MRPEPEHVPAVPIGTGLRKRRLQTTHSRRAEWVTNSWIPLALAAVTLIVFAPALLNGFVKWDDDINLSDNPGYRGLGWRQIRWMFTSTLAGHYIPVSWLSFGLDYTLWGMNPLGYHLTNILLHAANAALFYLVALRLIAKATSLVGPLLRFASASAALFFALHPLRVESVAWATERRDVLSGLFFLLVVLTYLMSAEDTHSRRWLLGTSLGCYALALLSKSIVMTLPLILIVLDVYPLGRLPWRWSTWKGSVARAVLKEKVLFLVLGLAGAITSYWAVASQHYLTPLEKYGWPARMAMAGYSLWFYLEKTVLPTGLSPLHELPAVVNPLAPRFLLSGVAAVILTVLLLALRRRWPGGLAVWVYYAIVLGPVTGIVHSGYQLTHDRYSYLSCLGWALLIGSAVGAIARAAASGAVQPQLARVAAAAGAVWILTLATLTCGEIQAWRDTETLWRYATEANPECSFCQAKLGDVFYQRNLLGLAKERYELALALRPDNLRAHSNLGLVLLGLGQLDLAMSHLRIALERHPGDPDAITAMAVALLQQRNQSDAIPLLERALRIDPSHFDGHANLGAALADTGEPEKGLVHLLRAVELRPDTTTPRVNLTRAYLAVGDYERARREYETLLRLDPHLAGRLVPAFSSVP
jgi:protein O-mannosyl-transferase